MENHTTTDPKDPASFLSSIIGVPVTVKLNSGAVYKGELQSVDGYMNIALEKCQEYVNGQLRRTYGDAFVRGNNGKSSCSTSCAFFFAPSLLYSKLLTDFFCSQCSISPVINPLYLRGSCPPSHALPC